MLMLRRWCILIITCAAANGFQQATVSSVDAERRADVYAIYSLMMKAPETSHGPDNNAIYLIGVKTEPMYPRQPCVRVPREYEASFAEVLEDYERRKDNPAATLERAFNIPKPYELLTGDDVKEFMERRSFRRTPYSSPKELFQKVTDLFRMSDVYFNRNRTLALTGISSWCGDICGMSRWKVFEKTEGQWKERAWVGCFTISRRRSAEELRSAGAMMPVTTQAGSWGGRERIQ